MAKYLKLGLENVIKDCISFPYAGYIEFTGAVPSDILGGWYKLDNGVVTEIPGARVPTKKDELVNLRNELDILKTSVANILQYLTTNDLNISSLNQAISTLEDSIESLK